ncbi:MAG: aldo/keto reductase [Naasia sp.]|jgi:2,5-diketo-D-gluconate reductase A|uniref:aldo/keto reductase n=1 Tax=Naasia sp. TaxID=2546198 RepID=UPI002612EFFD|nr:aldo/keto reductase [Naasia sp.]MCU1569477.1 aldo/keto reductase [Naasia sp.]
MTSASTMPTVRLNDGTQIPQLGFGVFQVEPEQTQSVVEAALEIGYRHLDTAAAYRNEKGVGEAIAASGIPRADLWITTKLWNAAHQRDKALAAIDRSLELLGLDYVDLYLIHWPLPMFDEYVEAWKTLEEIAASGKAKSIGVSNFLPEHLERVFAESDVVPSVNQIELHPEFQQRELVEFCRAHDIAIEAWSPLASGNIVDREDVAEIAEKYGKTPAQVTLRWHLDEGRIVFPKSNNPGRQKENFEILDFSLTAEELAVFDALDQGKRIGADPATADFR